MPDILSPCAPIAAEPCRVGALSLAPAPLEEMVSISSFSNSLPALREAVLHALGASLPPAPGTATRQQGLSILWIGPNQWLACAPQGSGLMEKLQVACGAHAALTDQTDGRVTLTLCGPYAHAIAAKLVPIDLHPRCFGLSSVALTQAGHIPVILMQRDRQPAYDFIVFRSLARSLHHDILAAMRGGIPESEQN
ncbi:sarcosine oxidase subunit gamma [Komagataeibacter xylinus]|uniref:sarcosine oxidase subunit gamma n=1 Tax=Komagataeibacter xylinus TaxID=28448 RepID=UPI00103052FE|nr:sarcosine oxidase subunit gamma family protein [Komagataeibacter xylinus]